MTAQIINVGALSRAAGRMRPDFIWQGSGNHDTGLIQMGEAQMVRVSLIAAGNEIQIATVNGWGMHGVRYNDNNTTGSFNHSWTANSWGTPLYTSGTGTHVLCEIEACTYDGGAHWLGYIRGTVAQYSGFGCHFWANGGQWKFRHNGGNPYGIRIERFTAE